MNTWAKFGDRTREASVLLEANPRATQSPARCSPNFLSASITRYERLNELKHEPIVL